jgi:DNA-binding response OmpR family regulator
VETAKSELPDLILLDIKMPLGGGIKAFQKLQEKDITKNIPVIFITAFPSIKVKQQVIDMGAKGFISKPFNCDAIINQINYCLGITIPNSNQNTLKSIESNTNSITFN